jgi:hypothetical protein
MIYVPVQSPVRPHGFSQAQLLEITFLVRCAEKLNPAVFRRIKFETSRMTCSILRAQTVDLSSTGRRRNLTGR